jgi:hypothetical protein
MTERTECASCHMAYFTPNLVALSLPVPVLQYILGYLKTTKTSQRKPLHTVRLLVTSSTTPSMFQAQIFALMIRDDRRGINLRNIRDIIPYLGLYTLVPLDPENLTGLKIPTDDMPNLSILHNRRFIPAPPNTPPDSPNAARIFDVMQFSAVYPNPSGQVRSRIPLSPEFPDAASRENGRHIGPVHAAGFASDTCRM